MTSNAIIVASAKAIVSLQKGATLLSWRIIRDINNKKTTVSARTIKHAKPTADKEKSAKKSTQENINSHGVAVKRTAKDQTIQGFVADVRKSMLKKFISLPPIFDFESRFLSLAHRRIAGRYRQKGRAPAE